MQLFSFLNKFFFLFLLAIQKYTSIKTVFKVMKYVFSFLIKLLQLNIYNSKSVALKVERYELKLVDVMV